MPDDKYPRKVLVHSGAATVQQSCQRVCLSADSEFRKCAAHITPGTTVHPCVTTCPISCDVSGCTVMCSHLYGCGLQYSRPSMPIVSEGCMHPSGCRLYASPCNGLSPHVPLQHMQTVTVHTIVQCQRSMHKSTIHKTCRDTHQLLSTCFIHAFAWQPLT